MFVRIRWRFFNATIMDEHLPDEGLLVDIGCGHGSWALFMSIRRPKSDVLGIDPDVKKIIAAQEALKNSRAKNVQFISGTAQDVDFRDAALISLTDVLYLLSAEDQELVLRYCISRLKQDGLLLLKTMDERPRWKYIWNIFQETVAVRVLKFTYGDQFHFRNAAEWQSLLESNSLKVEVRRLDKGYLHPHVLILGRKV